MAPADATITTIAHVIQLAVAPVFLLTGIGALLGVMTNRLSRVIDRRRVLEGVAPCTEPAAQEALSEESRVLVKRGRLINRAIGLCTMSALLVCVVIAALFVAAFIDVDLWMPVGVLFIVTMLALVVGLVNFLLEIRLAMRVASTQLDGRR